MFLLLCLPSFWTSNYFVNIFSASEWLHGTLFIPRRWFIKLLIVKEYIWGIWGYNCWWSHILGTYLAYAEEKLSWEIVAHVSMEWVFKLSKPPWAEDRVVVQTVQHTVWSQMNWDGLSFLPFLHSVGPNKLLSLSKIPFPFR